jgi:hypothetical protein
MAVNLSPVGGVAVQFFTNSGAVLTGGKIFTYAAGTTTPQTTFTNASGSVPHSNPIILDASGRVPSGEIWLTDGFVYKFLLKDANDVLIGTYDNIAGINSNFVNFTNQQEIQTATAGQTVFTLATTTYQPGTNSLSVFVDGVNQYGPGASYAYVETNSTTITFNSGLHVGAEVKFTTSQINSSSATSADQVSYQPAGTGAVATNVQAKLRQTVSVKDFGAVGDGVADDTVAIQAALVSMVNGGSLLFPVGTYKITSPITQTFNNGVIVNVIGYGAKIDGSSVVGGVSGDTTLISLGGARLTGVALGTSAAKYATSITTASPISASVNDIALITSTDLWNPTRPEYYKGEMIEMRGISGTTIESHIALFDSYTNSTTTVFALSMPTVNVEGLEVVMNANQLALQLRYCRNPSVRHTKVYGARYTGISMQYCFGGTVDSNEVYDAWASVTGTSYGVAISTCQNFVVSKNNLTEARHCITSGGWEPCRNLIYAHNICTVHPSEPVAAAIDHHGNTEFSIISDNVANGGIVISSINSTIKDNIVSEYRSGVGAAIGVFQEINSDFYIVSGNNVTTNNLIYGFWHTPAENNLDVQDLTFNDNNIKSGGNAARFNPRNITTTGSTIKKLSVKNNFLETSGASQSAIVHASNGAATLTTELIDSANNIYISNSHDSAFFSSIISNTFSTNDKFYGNRLNGYLVTSGGVNVTFLNPYFEGSISGLNTSRSIRYISTGVVRCINPVFNNLQIKAELESGGPSLYIEQGWYAATPTITNPAGAKLVNFYGALGRAITYGTAAPTTNTWAVGDRVYNQTPAVGQPKSFVCTVAGTPGTWVSEGNL